MLKGFLTTNYIYVVIAAALLIMGAAVLIILLSRRIKAQDEPDLDELLKDGHSFEEYCAQLLADNGFENVQMTPQSRDFGVDIIAEKDAVTYAFQCKYYNHPVGTRAVQEIYAGRDYYHRMVGVVLTNEYYTAGAVKLAEALKIILWDDEMLARLENLDL